MNLFTEAADEAEIEQPVEMASAAQVRLLEGFNYRKEAVRKWTREKAETALRRCQQEERIAKNRALAVAKAIDGFAARGQPSHLERVIAADFIEQAQGAPLDELSEALAYTVYCLTDDETKRLAGYLVRIFREEKVPGAA